VFEPAANRSNAELNAKISEMQAGERESKSRLDQQSQAYAALSEKMHFVVQEHERQMREKDDAAQAALEETLSEIEALSQQLEEARALLSQKGSDIISMKVTREMQLLFYKPFQSCRFNRMHFHPQFPPFVSSVSASRRRRPRG
jgi:DNA repair exonuclease SbcCD ATPase subunit